jgi:hypothetical protein
MQSATPICFGKGRPDHPGGLFIRPDVGTAGFGLYFGWPIR